MEGTARLPGAALAQYQAAHPGTVISRVDSIWRAWLPIGDNGDGIEKDGHTEAELLAKLPS